ncbi:MAG: TrmH family RNA methyltransferase [Jatrophihabitans sp.]
MALIEITAADDPRLADFRDLQDADVRPDRRGIVIGEGVAVVQRLLTSPYSVRAVVGVAARMTALADELAAASVDGYVLDKWLLSDVVGFRVTRGVLASADRLPPADPEEILRAARSVVVLERLNDFENLGALFRNAAAFGVDAVLLDPHCADPLYRRSVRVSMGHALRVPFAVTSGSTTQTIGLLRSLGFTALALTPRAGAEPLRMMVPPPRWAVVLGAEGPGLTDATLAAADRLVRIPMAGGVDSLNVATAGAVAFAHLTG